MVFKKGFLAKTVELQYGESAHKKWGRGSRALSSLRLNNELWYWFGTPGVIVKIKDNAIFIILKRFQNYSRRIFLIKGISLENEIFEK